MVAPICPCQPANTYGIIFRLFLQLLALLNTRTTCTFAFITPFVLVPGLAFAPLLHHLNTHPLQTHYRFPMD